MLRQLYLVVPILKHSILIVSLSLFLKGKPNYLHSAKFPLGDLGVENETFECSE